jgi:glutathione peroxidase-family protein
MSSLHDFTVKDIKGNDWNLAELKGKVNIEMTGER